VFIDRNGRRFAPILDWLQDRTLPDENLWGEESSLVREAEFYCVNDAMHNECDVIVVVGGWNAGERSNKVFVFDPYLKKWSNGIPLPLENRIHGCCCAVVEDTIYVAGGKSPCGVLKSGFKFSNSDKTWTPIADMNKARDSFGCGVVDGMVYALGDAFEMYDPKIDQWEWIKQRAPEMKRRHTCAVLNEFVYVIGGEESVYAFRREERGSVHRFDTTKHEWERVASMATRWSHGCAVLNGEIYVVGGYAGSKTSSDPYLTFENDLTNSVEKYNPNTNQWTPLPPIRIARYECECVTANGKLYVIGGRTYNELLSSVEVYDPKEGCWSAGQPLPSRFHNHSAVSLPFSYVNHLISK